MFDKPNYLKYYRNTLFAFRDRYGLKISDIEFLFFIYDLESWNCTYVKKNYKSSLTFLTRNIPDLMGKGYISIYLEKAHGRARKYMISQRGRLLVSRFYRVLNDKEII
tara:strand:+ start:1717 stop:2040 length:324 start_codon:yes stop_codon:yes gene_type:complete